MASIEQAMSLLIELGYMKVLQEEFDGNMNSDVYSCRKPNNNNHQSYCCANTNSGTNSSDQSVHAVQPIRHVRLYNLASLFVKPPSESNSGATNLSLSIEKNPDNKRDRDYQRDCNPFDHL